MCKANPNDNKAFLGHLRKVNLCFLGVFCKNGNFIRLKFIEEINSVFQVLYVILMHTYSEKNVQTDTGDFIFL